MAKLNTRNLLAGRESASFGDLVLARRRRDDDAPARDRYLDLLRRFKQDHGEIVEDYWSESAPAAVALTCKKGRFRGQEYALHRRTGKLASGDPDVSRLLLHVDRQAVRGSNVLAGMSQRIAMSNLYSLTRDMTAYLEADSAARPDRKETVDGYQHELDDITAYAGQAASRQAQIIYLQGLVWGLFALMLLAPALAGVFSVVKVPGLDSGLFVACLVAGSFGAAMSVLMRMSSGRFDINHEFGREYVTNLGFARPFIGAIFAVLLYFAFQGQLLQQVDLPEGPQGQFAFFVASGFLIGFSERFAKEIVRTAEPRAGGETAVAIAPQPGISPMSAART